MAILQKSKRAALCLSIIAVVQLSLKSQLSLAAPLRSREDARATTKRPQKLDTALTPNAAVSRSFFERGFGFLQQLSSHRGEGWRQPLPTMTPHDVAEARVVGDGGTASTASTAASTGVDRFAGAQRSGHSRRLAGNAIPSAQLQPPPQLQPEPPDLQVDSPSPSLASSSSSSSSSSSVFGLSFQNDIFLEVVPDLGPKPTATQDPWSVLPPSPITRRPASTPPPQPDDPPPIDEASRLPLQLPLLLPLPWGDSQPLSETASGDGDGNGDRNRQTVPQSSSGDAAAGRGGGQNRTRTGADGGSSGGGGGGGKQGVEVAPQDVGFRYNLLLLGVFMVPMLLVILLAACCMRLCFLHWRSRRLQDPQYQNHLTATALQETSSLAAQDYDSAPWGPMPFVPGDESREGGREGASGSGIYYVSDSNAHDHGSASARWQDLSAGLERLLAREQLQNALGAAAPAIVLGAPLPGPSEWPFPTRLLPLGALPHTQAPGVVGSWEDLMSAARAAALAEQAAAVDAREVQSAGAQRPHHPDQLSPARQPQPRRMALPGITPMLIQDLPNFILPERLLPDGKSGATADAHGGGGDSSSNTTPVAAAAAVIRPVALPQASAVSAPLGIPSPAELIDIHPGYRSGPGEARAGRFAGGGATPPPSPPAAPSAPQPVLIVQSRSEPQVEHEETRIPSTSSAAAPLPYMETDRQRTSRSWLQPRWRSARRMRQLVDESSLPRALSPSPPPAPSSSPSSIHLPHVHLHPPGGPTAVGAGMVGGSQPLEAAGGTAAVLHAHGDCWGGHSSAVCDSGATTAVAQSVGSSAALEAVSEHGVQLADLDVETGQTSSSSNIATPPHAPPRPRDYRSRRPHDRYDPYDEWYLYGKPAELLPQHKSNGRDGGGAAVREEGSGNEVERECMLVAQLAWRLADGTGTCTVCLSGFAPGEELRLLPGCGHVFHCSCIDRWLSTSATCPNCRTIVMPAWVVEMVLELAAARQRRSSSSSSRAHHGATERSEGEGRP
ncbi:hypothetical protein VaNZ11_011457 [Volvox africanus]|uniref:RING-type domain-containing protein n=1 Tax=Volvox africanus TaxID=51714 RepID=A0ABQ5SBW0_9CHLO|nr:hypothetical protein VaNZ11_011457 [Volvox africanus]